MATESHADPTVTDLPITDWAAGALGGFVGAILMGLVMPTPTLEMAIPAMYGIEGPALLEGWILHQFHGVVLGLAYVALVQFDPIRELANDVRPAIGLGIGYGVLTTIVLGTLVMPIWLSVVGFAGAPSVPNVGIPQTLLSLVAHVLYAIPVAIAYALTTRD